MKTRALAAKSCELGRVESNGQVAKPSREVRIGDRLQIRFTHDRIVLDVLALSEIRGPAAVAQTLYLETDQSRAEREHQAAERRVLRSLDLLPEGRPSKRDRRQIDRLRGRE